MPKLLSVQRMVQDGIHVVLCLDYNICAQGDTAEEAEASLRRLICGYARWDVSQGSAPFHTCRPSPPEYWAEHPISYIDDPSGALPPG